METVVIGLGSNLGDRAEQLCRAVAGLAAEITVTALSSLYQSAPRYVLDQPAFLNMVLLGKTSCTPQALMALAKRLEQALGRTPAVRYGPRQIDIDILFYGALVLDDPVVTLPHPRLAERGFVLVPMAEIASEWVHPRFGLTIGQLRAALADDDDVTPLDSPRPADWIFRP